MTVSSPVTEDQVHTILERLVALEPDPAGIDSQEQYEAAMAPHAGELAEAMATLRRFAEQRQPASLEDMQYDYYGFTNDPRHLRSSLASGVVTSALNEAWDGVGRWRR